MVQLITMMKVSPFALMNACCLATLYWQTNVSKLCHRTRKTRQLLAVIHQHGWKATKLLFYPNFKKRKPDRHLKNKQMTHTSIQWPAISFQCLDQQRLTHQNFTTCGCHMQQKPMVQKQTQRSNRTGHTFEDLPHGRKATKDVNRPEGLHVANDAFTYL